MKNYVKEGQKLPLYGVGPYIVYGMAAVTAAGIVLFSYVFRIGTMSAPWTYIFRIAGGFLIALGAAVWFIGALRSGMDEHIAENKLKTDGIYAWVRVWILITPFINWLIMTVALKKTEEKWLLDLYGNEYAEYQKRVNRCIPWKRQ